MMSRSRRVAIIKEHIQKLAGDRSALGEILSFVQRHQHEAPKTIDPRLVAAYVLVNKVRSQGKSEDNL